MSIYGLVETQSISYGGKWKRQGATRVWHATRVQKEKKEQVSISGRVHEKTILWWPLRRQLVMGAAGGGGDLSYLLNDHALFLQSLHNISF